MTSPKSPARATRVRPTRSRKRLSEAELAGLIDEGIEKSIRTALEVLDDPDAAGYVKLSAAKLFHAPLMRRLTATDEAREVTPQEKFLSLMREIRDVPVRETVVTETAIEDVRVDDVPEFVSDVEDEEDEDEPVSRAAAS